MWFQFALPKLQFDLNEETQLEQCKFDFICLTWSREKLGSIGGACCTRCGANSISIRGAHHSSPSSHAQHRVASPRQ